MKLGELIMSRAAELGGRRRLTYRELSERAKAEGHTLSEVTINNYVIKPLPEVPKVRTMRALAAALDVPYDVVVAAAAASVMEGGDELVQVADETHVRAWVTLTEGRTDPQRRAMINAVRAVAEALDAGEAAAANGGSESPVLDEPPGDRSRNIAPVAPSVTKRTGST